MSQKYRNGCKIVTNVTLIIGQGPWYKMASRLTGLSAEISSDDPQSDLVRSFRSEITTRCDFASPIWMFLNVVAALRCLFKRGIVWVIDEKVKRDGDVNPISKLGRITATCLWGPSAILLLAFVGLSNYCWRCFKPPTSIQWCNRSSIHPSVHLSKVISWFWITLKKTYRPFHCLKLK